MSATVAAGDRWERLARALGGPLIWRDCVATQRQGRLSAVLVGVVSTMAGVVLLGLLGAGAARGADPEEVGRVLVQIVYWGGAVVVTLVLPALASVPIVAERERKGLDLLLVTGAPPTALVAGAAGAAAVHGALALLVLLPLVALALIFGGVPLWMVGCMGATLVAGGALAIAIGAHASAVSQRTVRAVVQAYLATAALVGLLLALAGAGFTELLWEQERGALGAEERLVTILLTEGGCEVAMLLLGLALVLARNALVPPGGNRATVVRLWLLVALAWVTFRMWLMVVAWLIPMGIQRDVEAWRVLGTTWLAGVFAICLAAVVAAATEDPPGRRGEAAAARFHGLLAPLRVLYPGAERGAVFSVGLALVALGGAAVWLEWRDPVHAGVAPRAWMRSHGVPIGLAVGGIAHLAAVAGFANACRAWIGRALAARYVVVVAWLAVQVLAGIAMVWSTEGGDATLRASPWNGTLVSIVALVMGAFLGDADRNAALDIRLGEHEIPFPVVFALANLLAGMGFVALAAVGKRRARRTADSPRSTPNPQLSTVPAPAAASATAPASAATPNETGPGSSP